MDERFLYEVRPLRIICIPGQERSKKPFVALLTKQEVKTYMTYGPVYRKYADPNKEMVRVTGENLDRLHHTMPENGKPNKPVSDIIPIKAVEKNEPVVETPAPVVEEKKVEEPKVIEEEELKKSNVEESTTPQNEVEASTEDIVTEEEVVEVVEEPVAQEETNDGADDEVIVEDEAVADENIDVDETDDEQVNTEETTEEVESEEETVEDTVEEAEEATTEESTQKNTHNNNNVQFNSNKKKKH